MAQTPVEVKKTTTAPAPASDPWHSLRTEMDRLFDRFADGFRLPSWRRMFDAEPMRGFETSLSFAAPAIDVAEDDKAYKITAELPGLVEKDIDISIAGDMLTLKGEKQQQKEEKNKNYYMSERSYGSFQRSFMLPDGVDTNKIAADLSKGVLTVTLPKTAEAQKPQKKIEVKAA
jgi:HSP20 family protein